MIVFETSGGVCIISVVSDVEAPIGIAGASFTLIFSLKKVIITGLLNITRNKKQISEAKTMTKCKWQKVWQNSYVG